MCDDLQLCPVVSLQDGNDWRAYIRLWWIGPPEARKQLAVRQIVGRGCVCDLFMKEKVCSWTKEYITVLELCTVSRSSSTIAVIEERGGNQCGQLWRACNCITM